MGRKLSDYDKIEKATGLEVVILGMGRYRSARLYHRDKLDELGTPTFTDYEFATPDISVKITDEDAYFYYPKDGEPFLDMSPQTLGLDRDPKPRPAAPSGTTEAVTQALRVSASGTTKYLYHTTKNLPVDKPSLLAKLKRFLYSTKP